MDLENLDLKKLRAFYLVAKFGSLQRAASILNVTVSAVSFSIRRLEEQIGIQVFQRLPNKLVLTAAGERLLHSAEAIFLGIEKILGSTSMETSPKGRLAVSVNSDLAWYFIPKISGFMRRYPEVEINVYIQSSTESLRLIERGELNLGIGRFRKVPKAVEKALIVESSLSLVCKHNHPILRRKVPSLQDMARYKLVTLPGYNSTKKLVETAFSRAGLKPKGYIEAGSCQTIAEFAEAELGIGLMHSFCAKRQSSALLRYVDLGHCFGRVNFSAAYRKDAIKSSALLKLLETCMVEPH